MISPRVGGRDEVSDVETLRVERAGDAGVNQMRDVEAIDERLRTDAGVHLADAALDDHNVLLAEPPLVEVHAQGRGDLLVEETLAQELDLDVHRADDSDLHLVPLLLWINEVRLVDVCQRIL